MSRFFGKVLPAVVAILCICLILVVCGATMLRCGPIAKASEVSHNDYFKNFVIKLKINATDYSRSGHWSYFDASKSLVELKDLANSMTNSKEAYDAQIIKEILLIKVKSKQLAYFAIQKLNKSTGRYVISDLMASISKSDGNHAFFVFPYQFYQGLENSITSRGSSELNYNFVDNDELNTDYSFEEWKKFYSDLEQPSYTFNDGEHVLVCESVRLTFIENGTVRLNVN